MNGGRFARTLAQLRAAPDWPWNLVLPIAFAIGSARSMFLAVLVPDLIGSHAPIYTDATHAWLSGGDPWQVGPPEVVFAGPPPMLALFLPFVGMPYDAIRVIWFVGSVAIAIWMLRRLGLPGYWIGFPPIFQVMVLGHPEIVLTAILLFGGVLGGLAPIIKPYMGFVLLAERRWRAIALAAIVFLVTLPFLPWSRFLTELPMITANLARQYHGDGVFGEPLLMVIGAIALLSMGPRLALWLATPLLWPYVQPGYKIMTLPVISPLVAAFWALPFPGATLVGVVAQAVVLQVAKRRELPTWLAAGVRPAARDVTSREIEPAAITSMRQRVGGLITALAAATRPRVA
jgi:hypothetical protein